MKIYVASSWRNTYYPQVVETLRQAGYEVYDFRNPPTGEGMPELVLKLEQIKHYLNDYGLEIFTRELPAETK